MNQILENHNLYTPRPGNSDYKEDFHKIEWGRESNTGFVIGRSSFPVFFTADGHNVHLQDSARGAAVMILTPNAPTNGQYAKAHTWTLGEAHKFGKPNLMTIYENPQAVDLKYWNNPSILKILPTRLIDIHRSDKLCVSHSPSTFYFRRHRSCNITEVFNEETIWYENSPLSQVFSLVQLALIMGYRKIFINRINWSEKDPAAKKINNCISMLSNNKIQLYNCGKKAGNIPSIGVTKAFKEVFYE